MKVEHVLQVCYSSVWSRDTLLSFRNCLAKVVIQFPETQNHFHSNSVDSSLVLALLKLWQITDISLSHAFSSWFKDSTLNFSDVANWLDYKDREALVMYKLTGKVLDGDIGSVTMFASLPSIPQRETGENFMNCIPIEQIHEAREFEPDLISASIRVLKRVISTTMKLINENKIQVTVRLGKLEDFNPELMERIKSLNAYTINWHCFPDNYLNNPKSFHEIAVKCSGPETVHSMTSTSWHKNVKGASVIDYPTPKQRSNILSVSKKVVDEYLKKFPNFSKRFNIESQCFSPILLSDYVISSTFVQTYISKWKSCYKGTKLGSIVFSSFPIFCGDICGGVYVTWTYNSMIEFIMRNY